MSDEIYCYPPDYRVLKNKFEIRDSDTLAKTEREYSSQRMRMDFPTGDFDLSHLKAIHHHLFQDVYEWAGEIRTVEISKGGNQFMFRQYIVSGMADIHKRIRADNYLVGLGAIEFSKKAGAIIGDVNYLHPFREGNGRTQMQYLKQLCINAGHMVDLTKIEKDAWMNASKQAHNANCRPMSACILAAIAD